MSVLLTIFVVITGYLMGSVCSAIVVSQLFELPDPRKGGSHNPGATNVLRLAGKKYAALVLLGDVLKGVIPVLVAKLLDLGYMVEGFAGLAAVLGHMYPVFFRFKGGKGVATTMGVLLALHPLLGIMTLLTWVFFAAILRYSSLASIFSVFLAPVFSVNILGTTDAFIPLMCITLMVLFRHRDNIGRLSRGEESKINFKSNMLNKKSKDKK